MSTCQSCLRRSPVDAHFTGILVWFRCWLGRTDITSVCCVSFSCVIQFNGSRQFSTSSLIGDHLRRKIKDEPIMSDVLIYQNRSYLSYFLFELFSYLVSSTTRSSSLFTHPLDPQTTRSRQVERIIDNLFAEAQFWGIRVRFIKLSSQPKLWTFLHPSVHSKTPTSTVIGVASQSLKQLQSLEQGSLLKETN